MISDERLTSITYPETRERLEYEQSWLESNEIAFTRNWLIARQALPDGRWYMWHPLTWREVDWRA